MKDTKPAMKMPELLVFARLFVVGFVIAETFRSSFYLSASFAQEMNDAAIWAKGIGMFAVMGLCLIYMIKRGAFMVAARMGRSYRLDLLIAVGIGVWSNELASPWLSKLHVALLSADPHWAPAVLIL